MSAPFALKSPELGMIAGNRSLPLVLAKNARAAGIKRLVAVGFENETDPALAQYVDELIWLRVGQMSKLISAFQNAAVTQCVMVGQIAPRNLFDLRPDFRAVKLLMRLKQKNAHTIFGAIADELESEGIQLIEPIPWLQTVMPRSGFHMGPALSSEQREDVDFALGIARETSRLEIGQTVVVKNGTVLAVEAFEGTDACLKRGGDLEKESVAIKVAKSNHDFRFDIPCIGLKTLEVCADAKIKVMAFEAGRTLLLDEETVSGFAAKKKISIVAI